MPLTRPGRYASQMCSYMSPSNPEDRHDSASTYDGAQTLVPSAIERRPDVFVRQGEVESPPPAPDSRSEIIRANAATPAAASWPDLSPAHVNEDDPSGEVVLL